MTSRKSRAGAADGGRRARPKRDPAPPANPDISVSGEPGEPSGTDVDDGSLGAADGFEDVAALEGLDDDVAAALPARAARPSYEEIRRLLAGVIREAAGLVEAQESVCGILFDELEHFSWVGIYMVDGDELELAAWAGQEETEHVRIPIGEGICGAAAASGETEIVPDVREDERFIACFPSTRSEIVVPIFRAGEVVGEIDVDSDELDAFDERDVRLLEWTATRLGPLV